MRILVTGAQGCIGAWIVKGLLDRGLDAVIYDLDPHPHRLSLIAPPEAVSRVKIEIGRIEDTQRIKSIVAEQGITHIIHLAAMLMPYCQTNPVSGGVINVTGTLSVFEAARDAGRPVRVVYASSSAVLGPLESYGDKNVSEEDPLRPSTHYGVFKQANEGSARVFYTSNGISSIGLRPWAVYGVGRDAGLTGDPTLAIKAVVQGRPFKIRLSGMMDFQYVYDIAETFIRCLLSDVQGAHVFNIAGELVSIEDFIGLLEDAAPGATRLISNDGPQVPVAYRIDDSQLRSLIHGIPRTTLRDGISQTLEIFRRLHADGRLSG